MDSNRRTVPAHCLNLLTATAAGLLTLAPAAFAQTLSPIPLSTPTPSPVVSPSPTPVATPSASVTPTSSPAPSPKPTPVSNPAVDPLNVRMSLGDGRRLWHPTRRTIGIILAADYTDANPRFAVKQQVLTTYLKTLAPLVVHPAIAAKVDLQSSTEYQGLSEVHVSSPVPISVKPGTPGTKLDIPGSIDAIDKSIVLNPAQTHIPLKMDYTTPPKLDAVFDSLTGRLAHFVTHFNPGEAGRTQTVRLAISLVNGTVVQPGATFSLNATVGERTAARGFGEGIVFVDGHLDKQLGGGMCQVATTLYNAVLLAHLSVVERHAHARTVPYVEPGQDATVYWGSKDFKFQNNTDSPIYISYHTTATHAVCDLYGKYVPGLKVRVVDDFQRLGQRHFKAKVTRYVIQDGKHSIDYVSYSDYNWTPSLDYTF